MEGNKGISVDSSFKVKIGDTEINLNQEQAEELYGELYRALGKYQPYIQFIYPNVSLPENPIMTWGCYTSSNTKI